MTEYVLPHANQGEWERLRLMSALLDPTELDYLAQLGIAAGWRCLELGCGNGTIATALAQRVAPTGHVVASDLDITYLKDLRLPCLEVRRLDILQDTVEADCYDLVVARALLHHLTPARHALERMVAALKPGGLLLSIEPDMLPSTVAEPRAIREFWQAWLKWSEQARIDFFIGRKIAGWLDSLGLRNVAGEGRTPQFNGGSDWATYWLETLRVLRSVLLESRHFSQKMLDDFQLFYQDPHYHTSVITFTANWARKPLQ